MKSTVGTHEFVGSSGAETAKILIPRDVKIARGIRIIPNNYGDCIVFEAVGTNSVEYFFIVYVIQSFGLPTVRSTTTEVLTKHINPSW